MKTKKLSRSKYSNASATRKHSFIDCSFCLHNTLAVLYYLTAMYMPVFTKALNMS